MAAGDVIYVPEPVRDWSPLRVGATNRFVTSPPTVPVAIRVDRDGHACACTAYRVTCAGVEFQGTTDRDGGLTFDASVLAETATVRLDGLNEPIELLIGRLDPANQASGVSQRLQNMGYLPCLADGSHPADTVDFALSRFRSDCEADSSSDSSGAASESLVRGHGC